MVVSELIEILKHADKYRRVILQKDPEGNGYAPLSHHWPGSYNNGEAALDELTPEDVSDGFTPADVKPGDPAIFLVPDR